ncbi:bifunctional diguanylate cyclase/phosphodiesterase [Hyalangium sp.]|uniref:bifunctional diguanylate cyclase/phosphodiesterase n=1 Tax=Hyalangium sp. TaxID=2028555 RepID=UPI002D6F81AA|nr:bifunctional diguanylate cyclase/phosphodiesterase [Hyalangium sp.]HYI00954.1 bifunctional diguanylate cyclase/phosphodiesterase [Hyalangium sp.]
MSHPLTRGAVDPPAWLWDGDEPRITSVFQPIVDLRTGAPIGYEVLSRGVGPVQAPHVLFSRARVEGVSWELERACWTAAVRRIALLPIEHRRVPFFLNVGPDVLSDPRFRDGSTLELLARHGVSPRQIVLEITETSAFADLEQLQQITRQCMGQGFGIALDDFGAGHSGLVTLVHSAPHFIKLDQALVRDIHRSGYKQFLVKSLAAFASSVDCTLIAEGVETWDELNVLLRLGLRHAQGFLVARPASDPPHPSEEFELRRREATRALLFQKDEEDETVGGIVIQRLWVDSGMGTEELKRLFHRTPGLDHVVIVEGERPRALVTRQNSELASNERPLVVEDTLAITALARVAMERAPEVLYEPVVVTDAQGRFLGTVTMKQLIARAAELEVRAATGANPLTHLPGNGMIERWIRQALPGAEFAVIYGDLDCFNRYNDRYGFPQGDKLLRLTARVLSESLHLLPSGSHLGHAGGDDFVLVCPGHVEPGALEAICRRFDEEKRSLFDASDLERGYFEATDRKGLSVQVPPVTLSLAVLDSRKMGGSVHPASLSSLAASLKKKVKELAANTRASAFMFERRAQS